MYLAMHWGCTLIYLYLYMYIVHIMDYVHINSRAVIGVCNRAKATYNLTL